MTHIGFTAGNFDVIHPGYMQMFKYCKENCGTFVIFLHDDPSKERPNKLKPILTLEERKEILQGIRYVDKVITYETEEDLLQHIKQLPTAIRFLGEDYRDKEYTGKGLHIVQWIPRNHGWSTTKFKTLIAQSL